MYIDPFMLGILATLLAEFAALVVMAIFRSFKK